MPSDRSFLKGNEVVIRRTMAELFTMVGKPEERSDSVPNAEREAERIIEQLGAAERPQPTMSPCGYRVSVPAYLAGMPECMVRDVTDEASVREVNILVDISPSCLVSSETFHRRGAVIAALTEALQARGISVNLSVCTDCNDVNTNIQVVSCGQGPHALGTLLGLFASQSYAYMVLEVGGTRTGTFSRLLCDWRNACGDMQERAEGYGRDLRKLLGMAPTDVYVPETLSDTYNPVRWVAETLSQLGLS